MRWLLITAVVALPAQDEGVAEWVHAKIASQKGQAKVAPPKVMGSSKQLWKERSSNAQATIPSFRPPSSLAPLVKALRPGVVNISTRYEGTKRALGSGFVINSDGLVVTNNHVVERAQRIQVRLADGSEFDGVVVGRDPATDLALLHLPDAKGLPTVILGDSDQLEVGDWVVAIGNPFGLEMSVTHGLISARERVIGMGLYDDFIQTDALINPGNSGGPLFDMRGEVVGVTTAISNHGQGIGFAVPINLVKDLLPNLLDDGRAERGWLGLSVQEAEDSPAQAPIIVDVYPGSPAEKAGLQRGDRVVGIDGKQVQRYQQILRRIALLQPGTEVNVEIVRGGRAFEFTATLAERPSVEALKAMNSGGRIDALGLVIKPFDPSGGRSKGADAGLRVEAIVPNGPSERAGLMAGDIVVEVNRKPVRSLRDFDAALADSEPSEVVLLRIRREQALRYVAVKPHS